MERETIERRTSVGEIPWGWLTALLLLAMLFILLFASGDLLVSMLGQAATAADYVHEFAHDGRHLLAVPCH